MQFVINMNVDNAAFGESVSDRNIEVAFILRKISDRVAFGLADGGLHQNILDINGNVIGTYVYVASVTMETERAYA